MPPSLSPAPSPALLVLALLSLAPATAAGYVSSTTKDTGTRLTWKGSNCVYIRVNSTGSDDIKDGSDLEAVKRSVTKGWPDAIRSCSYIKFLIMPDSADAKPSFTKDGCNENVIYWVEKGWKTVRDFDPMAAAITTVFFVEKKGDAGDGKILDADLELNGEYFRWSAAGKAGLTDIENTVTHEIGHLLGLDHPCYDPTSKLPRPRDNQGNLVPDCSVVMSSGTAAHKEMREVTMFNYAEPGETKKRTPEADDVKGVCEAYPLASDPGECKQVCYGAGEGGCAVLPPGDPDASAASRRASLLFLLLLAGSLLLLARPRRSAR